MHLCPEVLIICSYLSQSTTEIPLRHGDCLHRLCSTRHHLSLKSRRNCRAYQGRTASANQPDFAPCLLGTRLRVAAVRVNSLLREVMNETELGKLPCWAL